MWSIRYLLPMSRAECCYCYQLQFVLRVLVGVLTLSVVQSHGFGAYICNTKLFLVAQFTTGCTSLLALVLTGKGIEEAVQELGYKSRTFGRKRSIAELMILEPEEFERIRERLARTSTGRRISQEELVIKCNEVLRKPHVQTKRRLAVAQGRLF